MAIIILNFEQRNPKVADPMANSVDPDLKEQSDLGLHCLHRPVCLKTLNHYGTYIYKDKN